MSKTVQVDTKTFVRFWLVIFALGVFIWFIDQAIAGLVIVGLAIFFAIAIQPLARWFGKRFDKKNSRPTLCAVLALLSVLTVVIFAAVVVAPVVVNETGKFISQAPEMFEKTVGGWDVINDFGKSIGVDNLQGQIYTTLKGWSSGFMSSLGNNVIASIGTLAGAITGIILVIVLTLLLLIEGPKLVDNFWNSIAGKDSKTASVSRRIVGRMANVVTKYITSQVTVAILDGTMTTLAVLVMSLIFGFSSGLAFPMGLITMIFYLIPMFGAIIGGGLVSILLFFNNPVAGVVFLVYYIIYQQIENNFIAPKVQGNALNLPPVVILIAITIGMYMFGLLGAIIAIPIAGCIKVLIEEYPNIRALKAEKS